ncbi:copper chaperone PCu(A)C [Devosia sp.]|uniref:copper chaperone PCu(A)C n=1 Tax=Devosia sp. TaxID=1871048 RepID=UPI003A958145
MTRSFSAALAASLVLLPSLAFAHAGISPKTAANGSSVKLAVLVPHGCDGAATDTVIVTVPEGFVSAKPQAKAGWQIETTTGDYAGAYTVHGRSVTSGVTQITWSGGNLPNDHFDEFVLRGSLMGFEVETQLPIAVTQLCGDGSVVWDEVAAEGVDPHSLAHPAPVLTVTMADAAHGHDHAAMAHDHSAMAATDTVTIGDLELSGAFSRATAPNAPVAGGYVTITNTGDSDDRLVAASSPVAGMVQLHEMKMDGDVMKMGELEDGISVPAGETVTLAPGGLHLMFMKLNDQLVEGETVPVTLTFEKAGSVDIDLAIGSSAATEPGHDHSAHTHNHGG